jgi:hypothetical protein
VSVTAPPSGTNPAPVTGDGGSAAGTARARWSRWRWPLAIALVIVLTALIAALTLRSTDDGQRLGPDNPGPTGSRALVQLLRRHADINPVVVHRSTDARSYAWRDATLLVTSPWLLGPEQLDRLAGAGAPDLVLVEPDEVTLARLAPQLRTAGEVDDAVREPGCDQPDAQAAGSARAGGRQYTAAGGAPAAPVIDTAAADSEITVCYHEPGNPLEGSLVSVTSGGRTVTVIGQSDLLTNRYLDRDGNAALALRTLATQPALVWYLPDPLEPAGAGGRASLSDLLPDWVFWVGVQLLVAAGLAVLWRARRLGRLVPEPLPVVVRAAETQEGRARLYRQSSARDRAAATLRAATLRRLATRLAAPAGTTPEQLAILVARRAGPAGPPSVPALLLGPAPESDAALVRLSDDLDALERRLSPAGPSATAGRPVPLPQPSPERPEPKDASL